MRVFHLKLRFRIYVLTILILFCQWSCSGNRSEKADAVCRVIEGPEHLQNLPAQQIQPVHGKLYWLLDRGAASGLQLTGEQFTDDFTLTVKEDV